MMVVAIPGQVSCADTIVYRIHVYEYRNSSACCTRGTSNVQLSTLLLYCTVTANAANPVVRSVEQRLVLANRSMLEGGFVCTGRGSAVRLHGSF